MTIILDGTAGLQNNATDLSYTGTLTGGTGVVNLGSGQVYKDASGNVGIGTIPSAWSLGRAIEVGFAGKGLWANNQNEVIAPNNAYFNSGWKYSVTGYAPSQYAQRDGLHAWYTAPSGTAGNAITFTQAMTLDSSGNLLVGTTSQIGTGRVGIQVGSTGADIGLTIKALNNGNWAAGFYNSSGTNVGSIVISASATAYNTSSDYRLKEAIAPMTGALAKVALLKPCTYKWKVDGSNGQGFIAHELAEVEAGCVTGAKDAVDEDGNPQYQGIDTSFLVATLTAAIQELKALVDTQDSTITALTARINALETA